MATVFRVEKNKDYTVMSNFHLKDKRLSLKAKGLLSLMLSLPAEWDYTLAGLAGMNKEGVDAIRTAVMELEQAGYIKREFSRRETGEFNGNNYVIFETPHENSPLLENPTTDSPLLDSPISDFPLPENPTELNTNRVSTNSTPYNPPQGGVSSQGSERDLFELFWRSYPRKTDKQRARRAFSKLRVDRPLLERMVSALQQQRASPQWRKDGGQYIPHASTWLSGRRWEDEPPGGPEKPEGGGYVRVVDTGEVPDW